MTCLGLGFGRGGGTKKKENQIKNKKNQKNQSFGKPTLGWGRGEGSPMHCFFWQIADSRWLTSLVETVNVIGKKVGPGWGG